MYICDRMGENINSYIGLSEHKDGFEAGKEAVKDALDEMSSEEIEESFGIVFCSASYDENRIAEGVDKNLECDWMGCTTSGEISNMGVTDGSVIVYLISSDHIDYNIAKVEGMNEDPISKGEELVRRGRFREFDEEDPESRFVILLKGGWKFDSEELGVACEVIKGISNELELDTPLVGGEAGDGETFSGETYQFWNGEVYTDSIIGLFARTSLKFGVGHSNGARKENRKFRITRTSGHNTVMELDGRPAAEVYAEAIGAEVEDFRETVEGIPKMVLMACQNPLCYDIGGERPLVRLPFMLEDEGGLVFHESLWEGGTVSMASVDDSSNIEALDEALELSMKDVGELPEAALFFNCLGRKLVLGKDIYKEVELIRDRLDIPFAGFYTHGEFGWADRTYLYAAYTVTNLVIFDELKDE